MSTGINLKDVRPDVKNPTGIFDLSYRRKFDHRFGDLIPFCWLPIIPDDEFDVSYDLLSRMAPFVSQVYQDYVATVDFYFVPNRLIWHNFSNFMQAGFDGKQSFIHPTINLARIAQLYGEVDSHQHLFNYFDIPNSALLALRNHESVTDYNINCLMFYAYLRIYLDHWIGTGTPLNKLVQDYVNSDRTLAVDGDNTRNFVELLAMLNSGTVDNPTIPTDEFDTLFAPLWRLYPLDYFTMARPDPQLGPVMTIPLELVNTDRDGTDTFKLVSSAGSSDSRNLMATYTQATNKLVIGPANTSGTAPGPNHVVINGSVFNNVASINDFYSAARVQELLVLYNYTGFRADDAIAAEFNLKSRDQRLHISDHIHHYQEDVQIGEVFSNAVSTSDSATDAIPGVGTAIGKGAISGRGFHFYSGEDYGWLIGLYSVYPRAGYNQGFPSIYKQLDRFDYPHPKLSQLGMESIKEYELFSSNENFATWDRDFAYNPRYSYYKVGIDRDNGSFADSLQYMTAARRFSMARPFNDQFLRVIPSYNHLNRTFNNQSYLPTSTPLFCDAKFHIRAKRNLPYYGLPQF